MGSKEKQSSNLIFILEEKKPHNFQKVQEYQENISTEYLHQGIKQTKNERIIQRK